jgi:hypothetical protein
MNILKLICMAAVAAAFAFAGSSCAKKEAAPAPSAPPSYVAPAK